MEAVECGAASLAMVLAYHGKWVPLEHVRVQCGVSRDGSDAFKMTRAAQCYGLRVKALQREPEQLAELPLPAILYWEFNHFLVLTDVRDGQFVVNDPAVGRRVLSGEELSRAFTGLCLCFSPGPDFAPEGRPPSLWQSLVRRLAGEGEAIGGLLALNLILTVPALLGAGLARVFLEDYLMREQSTWLWAILLAMALGTLLAFVTSLLQQRLLLRLQNRLAVFGSVAYAWRLLQLPYLFFSQRSAAELVQRIRLNNSVANTLAGPAAQIALGLLNTGVYLLLMAFYDLRVALVSTLSVVVVLWGAAALNRQAQLRHQQLQLRTGRAYAVAVNGLRHFDTYRAQGATEQLHSRWLGAEAGALSARQASGSFDSLLQVLPMLARGFLMTLILLVSAERAIAGDFGLGSLLSLQLLAGLLLQPLGQLMALNAEIQASAGALLRLDDLENYPASVPTDDSAPDDQAIDGQFEAQALSFAYQPGEDILRSVSFTIRPGVVTAIVGASGSGKSTLAKLLVGLLEPASGSLKLDGRGLSAWPRAQKQVAFGYVEQSNQLMTGDLSDNLSLWQHDLPQGAVVAAARQALVHDVIAARPSGYHTQVSPHRHSFSGGEVQRLCIARALAHEPEVLVLDEATSALDSVVEQHLMQQLAESGKTVIVVTHRPSTVAWCEDALVLRNGDIVQAGPVSVLRQQAGPFHDILEASHD